MKYSLPSWHRDAACGGSELDFTTPLVMEARRAQLVCRGCPVMRDCAREAIELGVGGEVRAGLYVPGRVGREAAAVSHLLHRIAGLEEQ